MYPHALESILKQPPDRWLSNARVTHYQPLLLNPSRITFQTPTTLNPATVLPDPDLEAPFHDCTEILAQACCIQSDLHDTPLTEAEETWSRDGSSFVRDGHWCWGCSDNSTYGSLGRGPAHWFLSPEGRADSINKSLASRKRQKYQCLHRQQVSICHLAPPCGDLHGKGLITA